MARPSVFRIIIKDLIDCAFISACAIALTIMVYLALPRFTPVEVSIYFFEQVLELFFVNPRLLLWLGGLGFGVSTLYFLICGLANVPTLGGLFVGVKAVDYKTRKPPNPAQALLSALGAFVGFFVMAIGPLYAWWLQPDHRGVGELVSGTVVVGRS